jgi:hypothetical protein
MLNVHINRDDWALLTHGVLRPRQLTLDQTSFDIMMREQLKLFTSSQVIDLMRYTENDNFSEEGLPPLELQRAIKMLTTGGVRSATAAPGEVGRSQQFAKTDPKVNEVRQQLRVAEEEIRKLKEENRKLKSV